MINLRRHPYWVASLTVGVLLLAYRLLALAIMEPGFFFDEAYYYGWSLTPDWGYYSKPPMVAWFIWLSNSLFGVSEFTVKLPASLLYLATAFIVQKTTNEVANPKAGFWAFMIFILMPFVSLNSWFITTDAPLLFFWSLTVLFYLRAEKTQQWQYWLLAGIFGGLGLLSKYTMILLPASIFFMYLLTGHYKKLLNWKFWLTVVTALLVFSPNIIWQFQNGFPSFIHTAELANKPGWDGNPHIFFPAQFLVYGPVAFFLLLSTFNKKYRQAYPELWYLSWVPLIFFIAKSFQGEAFINWSAFSYASAAILTGIVIADSKPSVKASHIAISLILAIGFYHYPWFQTHLGIEKTKKNTPYARVDGWRELMYQLKDITEQYPDYYIGSFNRTVSSYINYYIPNASERLRTPNLDGHISNHYELFYKLGEKDKPIIWVSRWNRKNLPFINEPAQNYFIKMIEQPVYENHSLKLWVYVVN